MARKITCLVAGFVALALLGACGGALEAPSDAKRPVVQPLVSLHAVRFAPGSAELAQDEAQRLAGFVAAVDPQPGDPLLVELPAASGPGDLAARRASAVAAGLAALGLPSRGVALAEPGGDSVRVAIETVALNAPADCPARRQIGAVERFGNGVAANFGCATAENFSAMLDRPRDALEGRATGDAPAERLTTRVRLYDAGVPLRLAPPPGTRGGTGGGAE